jgi:hypothetical protein
MNVLRALNAQVSTVEVNPNGEAQLDSLMFGIE